MLTDKEWHELGTVFACPHCFEDFDVAEHTETCPHCGVAHGVNLEMENRHARHQLIKDRLRALRALGE